MSACPLCGQRRGRRACPAVAQTICAVCCGTKRLREIACPPACPYLSVAREHPPAVVQRRQEHDMRFFAPLVTGLSEPQSKLLMLFQALILKVSAATTMPPLSDEDVAKAAAAAASTLETAGKGILYEHRADSSTAQALADELTRAVAEIARAEPAPSSRLQRDAAAVLRRIEHGARSAPSAMPGDPPPVYLGLLARIMEEFHRSRAEAAPQQTDEPRIIIP